MVFRLLLRSTNKLPHFRENSDQKIVTGRGHCGSRIPKRKAIRLDGFSFWQAALF